MTGKSGACVMVVGSGGREHVLAAKLAASPQVQHVIVAPGNPGTAAEKFCKNFDTVKIGDSKAIVSLVKGHGCDLVVVGPEAPLVDGLADELRAEGILVFGPGKKGAQIEGSKSFAKRLMQDAGVPTSHARSFWSHVALEKYLRKRTSFPVVIKADGLAAGKGVVVANTMDEALAAAQDMMVSRRFGNAGNTVLVEDFLLGRELSVFGITDGKNIVTMEPASDYKRAKDGDKGGNTGGMGSICPTPIATPELMQTVHNNILVPTMDALRDRNISDYRGCLYAGLMADDGKPNVVEFNCRFGDPELQSVLMRLDSDLYSILLAAATGDLSSLPRLKWDPRVSVTVVIASKGYPDSSSKGDVITGLEEAARVPGVKIWHSGTRRRDDGALVTDGGRVLGITALGSTMPTARAAAYEAVRAIHFSGMQYRTDIGAGI